MPTPKKEGLEHVPLDPAFFDDQKIKLLDGKFENDGPLFFLKLLCLISKKGYFIHWDEETMDEYATIEKKDSERLNAILQYLLKRGLFDKGIYDKYRVLTSKGIQERFFDIVSRRAEIKVVRKYLVIKLTPKHACYHKIFWEDGAPISASPAEQETYPTEQGERPVKQGISPAEQGEGRQGEGKEKARQGKEKEKEASASVGFEYPSGVKTRVIEGFEQWPIPIETPSVTTVPKIAHGSEGEFIELREWARIQCSSMGRPIPSVVFNDLQKLWIDHGPVRMLWAFYEFATAAYKPRVTIIGEVLSGEKEWYNTPKSQTMSTADIQAKEKAMKEGSKGIFDMLAEKRKNAVPAPTRAQ